MTLARLTPGVRSKSSSSIVLALWKASTSKALANSKSVRGHTAGPGQGLNCGPSRPRAAPAALFLVHASVSVEFDLEVMGARMGVVVVRGNFLEPQILVERARRLHVVKRVEQHAAVAGSARLVEDPLGQPPAQAKTSERLAHKQAFHFGSVRIVGAVERAQGAAARQRTVHPGQQQGAAGCGVITWQRGQFGIKGLEVQVDAQRLCVLEK